MIECGHGASLALETFTELTLGKLDCHESINACRGLVASPTPPAPIGGRISWGPSLPPAESGTSINKSIAVGQKLGQVLVYGASGQNLMICKK